MKRHALLATALMLAVAALASARPETFELDREALREGELWRLWTGHWVHRNSVHFLFDVGTAAILVALLRRWWTWLLLPPLVGIGVLALRPDVHVYAGLSGVLHGWTVLVCVDAWQRRALPRALAGGMLASVLVKVVLECALQRSLVTGSVDMGGAAVYEAHLLGAVAGVLLAAVGRFSRGGRGADSLLKPPCGAPV